MPKTFEVSVTNVFVINSDGFRKRGINVRNMRRATVNNIRLTYSGGQSPPDFSSKQAALQNK